MRTREREKMLLLPLDSVVDSSKGKDNQTRIIHIHFVLRQKRYLIKVVCLLGLPTEQPTPEHGDFENFGDNLQRHLIVCSLSLLPGSFAACVEAFSLEKLENKSYERIR